MAGSFEIFVDKGGKHCFRLKAGNGEPILASQGYKSKSGCKNGIESVRRNAADLKNFQKTETKNGRPRFNLRARNNQVIGTSETYNTTAARDNGIKSVQRNAATAKIKEV